MKTYRFLIFAVIMFGAGPEPKNDATKADKVLLEGAWSLSAVEINGKVRHSEQIGECVWITKDGKIDWQDNKKKMVSHYISAVPIETKLIFTATKCSSESTRYGSNITDETDYEIDVSKKPKCITFPLPPQEEKSIDSPLRYIYSVTKDELRLCWGIDKPPSGFDSKKNKNVCVLIYKRQKQE